MIDYHYLKQLIALVLIFAIAFQINIFLHSQDSHKYMLSKFQKAVDAYISGKIHESKGILNRTISYIEKKKLAMNDLLGKCYLLLGACYEKEGYGELAEKNYREAIDKYNIKKIDGVDVQSLPIYKKVLSGEVEQEQSTNVIQGLRKKKKIRINLTTIMEYYYVFVK